MAILRRNITSPRPPAEYTANIAAHDARRIAENRGLKCLPFDVVGLARSIGIKVEFLPLADGVSGFLHRRSGDWIIGVNSLHHKNRQRFTIAHELGHYFLHRDQGDFEDRALFRKDLQVNHLEYEANSFASKILMPEDDFKKALVVDRATVDAIAEKFEVSVAAAQYRAEGLGAERIFG
jgi:Zn-dependent peptidase ImmA (M78 family)